ncbi:MAG TPA: electron transport complex subunit RsxC [Candidatus Faeciplasma avium]|uniref:Ion-translocating oxidoreductase complex subunit C n=1 Tax=Candidatus Faeciplasma avium TaxID=2840798 RepID=A0A9D1NQU2_9FIRM|nr:electron transport complex subunit RsxC [Candidatus Faeciplasma avium]
MKTRSFKGGVHPAGGKELSSGSQIVRLEPKGELIFPMLQHIGAPATPAVKPGDRVLLGSVIGRASGFVSCNIISSVSGTVKRVEPIDNGAGTMIESVVIESDSEYEAVEGFGDPRDYDRLSKDEIRRIISEAGLVGMGGAGFPTSVKLAVKDDSLIDYVIVNGAECEPYITCDHRLMLERTEKAVLGLKILLRLFENAKGVFAVENNKPDAIGALGEAVKGSKRMYVQPLKTKYPQGGERVVVNAVTGRRLSSKKLPSELGCVVVNLATVAAVADAVAYSTPLVSRIVTVTGEDIKEPSNFEVPLGTATGELVEAAGGFLEPPKKIILGGPMMGSSVSGLNVPVTKTTSCILCLKNDGAAAKEPSACIRCGRCLDVCPERLMPAKLKALADRFDYGGFEKLGGLECIGCGSCTYICPAKRRLSQSITAAKRQVLADKRAAAQKRSLEPSGGKEGEK